MGPDHKALRDEYASKLAVLLPMATRALEDEIATERKAGTPDPEAVVKKRRRGPPAAHPRIIALIRQYYFACDRLNEQKKAAGVDEFATPDDFVFSHLETKKYYKLWESLCELAYWPIGIDREGKPV
jgi:hypothetical protein